jgi:hypothetical protein
VIKRNVFIHVLTEAVTALLFWSSTTQGGPCEVDIQGEVFCEDFVDGKTTVEWVSRGHMTFDTESMVLEGIGNVWADVNDLNLANTSIRTRARFNQGGYLAIAARELHDNSANYFGALSRVDQQAWIGIGGSDIRILTSLPFEIEYTQQDVMMQLDVIDDAIMFWVWSPTERMPAVPLLTAVDDSLQEGDVFVNVLSEDVLGAGIGEATAEFRYVQVATASMTHPAVGDLNHNGELDANDIDLLAVEQRSPSPDLSVDLNDDQIVDGQDRIAWIHDLRNSSFGDANLDGEFNGNDLVVVFSAGKYEDDTEDNSGWTDGDWDGDGDFTSGDLVLAFQDGRYEQGLRPSVHTVPEPTSVVWPIVGLLLAVGRSRIRR